MSGETTVSVGDLELEPNYLIKRPFAMREKLCSFTEIVWLIRQMNRAISITREWQVFGGNNSLTLLLLQYSLRVEVGGGGISLADMSTR